MMITDENVVMYKYYENFAREVFDFFNGKLNKVIRAHTLNVIFKPNFNSVLGCSLFGYVEINIGEHVEMGRLYDDNKKDNSIKNNIIDTIIHELYHLDQEIDNIQYRSRDKYKYKIEVDNTFMGYMYILYHIDLIQNRFNILIESNSIRNMENFILSHANDYTRISSAFFYYNNRLLTLTDRSIYSLSSILNVEDNVVIISSTGSNIFVIKKNKIFNYKLEDFEKYIYDTFIRSQNSKIGFRVDMSKPNNCTTLIYDIKNIK